MWVIIGALVVLLAAVRVYICLPTQRSAPVPKSRTETARTVIVWGSGGHTTEMCRLIRELSPQRYSPMFYLLAHSDATSMGVIQAAELPHTHAQMVRVMRSREVKQSWVTTVLSTARALLQCFSLVWQMKPDLIICNGPGTCVPVCYVAFLYRVLGIMQPTIIFAESLCRVKTLSLSGKLLYPIADRFIVQWPQLAERYVRAEYVGKIC